MFFEYDNAMQKCCSLPALLLTLLFSYQTEAAPSDHLQESETQTYDIRWKFGILNIRAATLTTQINSKNATRMKLSSTVQPTEKLMGVYPVKVTAASEVILDPFKSRHFESEMRYGHEAKKISEDFNYQSSTGKTQVTGTNTKKGVTTPKTPKNLTYPIGPAAQDVLSSLFYFRAVSLPQSSGTALEEKLMYEGEPWTIRVRWKDSEEVPMFHKSKQLIMTDVYEVEAENEPDHKIYHAVVWMARNYQRTVIKAEGEFKYGSIRLQLRAANYLNGASGRWEEEE